MSQLSVAEHFDLLIDQGLKVIPLKVNSKAPMCRNWQKNWCISKSREKLQEHPDANIGLLLGDVIDVEGDSENANAFLNDLIGSYPHPSYKSKRSTHHLFKTPDVNLKLVKYQEIEFRGIGHQSVLPPSQYYGISYEWMTQTFPIPEMPKKLLKFYERLTGKKPDKKPNSQKIWCSTCNKTFYLHCKRLLLEIKAFSCMNEKWQCKKCRSIDLRPLIRQLN